MMVGIRIHLSLLLLHPVERSVIVGVSIHPDIVRCPIYNYEKRDVEKMSVEDDQGLASMGRRRQGGRRVRWLGSSQSRLGTS